MRQASDRCGRDDGAARRRGARALAAAALVLAALALNPPPSLAQSAPFAVIAPDEAAVTGFSGAPPPPEIAPGDDPAALTFIDPTGPSFRIVDLRAMGGQASAQVVGAPKPFTVPASQIGQAFGVALDDAAPPNVYVAASSAYGLPIAAPGPDGRLRHVRAGARMRLSWPVSGGRAAVRARSGGSTARRAMSANSPT